LRVALWTYVPRNLAKNHILSNQARHHNPSD
jgi:hypothetical protein